MADNKKILVISFEGQRPAQGVAMLENENLLIRELQELRDDPYDLMRTMQTDIEQKSKAGWVVMVEDRTHSFPQTSAISWNFDAPNIDGRTSLQAALDWYFALKARGQIFFADNANKYDLNLGGESDLLYAKNDEKGRLVYAVDWKNFSGGHRALLMCAAGAFLEYPLSERWMKVFCGIKKTVKQPPVWPVFRAMRNLLERQSREFEEAVAEMEAQKHV